MQNSETGCRKPKTLEQDRVKVELIFRGWTVRDLAQHCGLKPRYLTSALSEAFPCERTRFLIEAAFDYKLSIWSEPGALDIRKKCKDRHGFDPYTSSLTELRKQGVALGINNIFTFRQRSKLVDTIMSLVAIEHPTPTTR